MTGFEGPTFKFLAFETYSSQASSMGRRQLFGIYRLDQLDRDRCEKTERVFLRRGNNFASLRELRITQDMRLSLIGILTAQRHLAVNFQEFGYTETLGFNLRVGGRTLQDLKSAEHDELMKNHGYKPLDYHE